MTDFIISDLHVPFQDPVATEGMLQMVRHYRPARVVMNGDMLDCTQLSRFSRDPDEPESFKANIVELAIIIRKIMKYSKVVYVEGNHEARVQKYINDNAPALHGLVSIEGLLQNHLPGLEYIRTTPGESMYEMGDNLLVGHFGKAAKNTCYTVKLLVEKYMTNVVQAHTHRLGEYAIRGYNGILRGWECGCLCDLDPEYVAKPNWQQGFLVRTGTDEDWNMEIVHIDERGPTFRGKTYKGRPHTINKED